MILFLDFDGVMHPFGCTIDLYFCRLELLETWLRRRPGFDVVISSSWREVHPLDEMRSYFSDDVQLRVIDSTPILGRDDWAQYGGEPPPLRFEREMEIREWLRSSGEPWRPWVAVDDQAWLFKPFCDRLVVVDGSVGLTGRDLDAVDHVLQRGVR